MVAVVVARASAAASARIGLSRARPIHISSPSAAIRWRKWSIFSVRGRSGDWSQRSMRVRLIAARASPSMIPRSCHQPGWIIFRIIEYGSAKARPVKIRSRSITTCKRRSSMSRQSSLPKRGCPERLIYRMPTL